MRQQLTIKEDGSMRSMLSLISILLLGGTFATAAAAQDATPTASCIATTEAENEAIVQRWYDELFNQHNLDVIDELIAPPAPHHQSFPGELSSREDTRETFAAIFAAMPDIHNTVDEIMSDGDLVVARWTGTATFQSDLAGVAATGEQETFSGINIFEITCGFISESWAEVDRLAQFGLVESAVTTMPEPSSATPDASCAANDEAANAEIASRWIDSWNAHDISILENLATDATVHHWGQGEDTVGVTALLDRTRAFFDAFPDVSVSLDAVIVDDDLVAFRWTATGTHQGQFLDIAPTNAEVTWTGINIVRVECGMIAESWNETDSFGLMQQLQGPSQNATPAG
jgi:steroid delta-isomerase-like uncharacterized protein